MLGGIFVAAGMVRTTLTLPADLLEAADRAVRDGKADSRNALVAAALRRELAAQRRAAIDADLADMATDAEYQREAAQIMAEFAGADAEAARLLQADEGAYPYDDDERAELEAVARAAK
jgi:metal-responsive CopG/Arc/MetJ family transcriptional regulator